MLCQCLSAHLTPYYTIPLSVQDIVDLCSSSPDCYVTYDWDNRLMYAFIYHLFGLLWTNQFIVGFASVVVAGSVAQYYWNRYVMGQEPLSKLRISSALHKPSQNALPVVGLSVFLGPLLSGQTCSATCVSHGPPLHTSCGADL